MVYIILILMAHRNNKIGLLNKNQPLELEQQWLQLQDIGYNHDQILRNRPNRSKSKQAKNYQKLSNAQEINVIKNNNSHNAGGIPQLPRDAPFNPSIITLNGDTFKIVNKQKQKQPKKSKMPQMHVSCMRCDCVQSIPSTSDVFSCGRCGKINHCTPAYKIFLCGSCNSKVCYATGTSNMIRCTKCGTINKVIITDHTQKLSERYLQEFSQNPSEIPLEEDAISIDFKQYLNKYPSI